MVQTEPSQAVSSPPCLLWMPFPRQGHFEVCCPRAGRNTQRGELGRRQENKQRTRVFQACRYDFIKAFKPCFPGERQKEKVRLGCMSLASLCTVDRHSRAAPAFLHAVNVRILSRRTARRAPAPPAFSQLKLVASVAQKTPQGSGQWVCRWPAAPDDLLFV